MRFVLIGVGVLMLLYAWSMNKSASFDDGSFFIMTLLAVAGICVTGYGVFALVLQLSGD